MCVITKMHTKNLNVRNRLFFIELRGHSDFINAIVMKKNILLSGSDDRSARVWCLFIFIFSYYCLVSLLLLSS